MDRFAVIENDSRLVVNVIIWKGAEWLPPRDHLVVPSETANIGDTYDEEKKTFKKGQA